MARRGWFYEGILAGNVEAKNISEDENILSFHHPKPHSEIHAVIIPKKHISSILSPKVLAGTLLISMVLAVQKTAQKLGLDESGIYARTNAGAPGVTPDLHWQIVGPGIPIWVMIVSNQIVLAVKC